MQRHGRRDQLFFEISAINSIHYRGEARGERLSVLLSLHISLRENFFGAANMEFEKILGHKLFYRLIKNWLCVRMPCKAF